MPDEKNPKESEAEELVSLPKSTYNAVLDRIEELEEKLEGKKPDEDRDDIDDLASEGKKKVTKPETEEELDYDRLTNTELVRVLEKGIQTNLAQPLLTRLYQLDFQLQVRDLLDVKDKEGNQKFGDLMDYKKEIRDILIDNPKMSIERAYKLAKLEESEHPKKPEKKESERENPRRTLRHLPRADESTFSERPGVSPSATKKTETTSLKEAATRAADEVFGNIGD